MGSYLLQLGGSKPNIFFCYYSHYCNSYNNFCNYNIAASPTLNLLATFMIFFIIPSLQPHYQIFHQQRHHNGSFIIKIGVLSHSKCFDLSTMKS